MTSSAALTLPMRGKILPKLCAWESESVSAVASSTNTRS